MKVKNILVHFVLIIGLISGLIFSLSIWEAQYEEVLIIITTFKVLFSCFIGILLINSILALLRHFKGLSPSKEIYFGLAVIFMVFFIAQAILLPNLFTDVYDMWIIWESPNSLRIALRIAWISILFFSLVSSLHYGNHFRKLHELDNSEQKSPSSSSSSLVSNLLQKATELDEKLTKRVSMTFILLILVVLPGFLVFVSDYRPSENPNLLQASVPIYAIPSGSHNNTNLDLLLGQDLEVLDALETVCYNFQKMRAACGGYPTAVNTDFTVWIGDERHLYPNEICLQLGVSSGGFLYLQMYELEPNPIYLQLARDAADAILEAQDDVTGGFFTFAEFDDQNKAIEPHFLNPRRHSDFDDQVYQDPIYFLMDFYNETGEQKYADACHRAIDYLLEAQYPAGSWPQETNFIYPFYPYLQTLNDGVMTRNMQVLMRGIDMFPSREEEFQEALDRAFNWICDVQGNGGSSIQAGAWAEQYDFNDQPAWARNFEPPAMCTRETGLMMILLLEMYCRYNDTKYLTPVQKAYDWLLTCETVFTDCEPDLIKINKYYELDTNKPIWGVGGGKLNPEGEQYSYEITDFACGYHNTYAETAMYRLETLQSLVYNITTYQEAIFDNTTLEEKRTIAYELADTLTSDGLWINDGGDEYRSYDNKKNSASLINYLLDI